MKILAHCYTYGHNSASGADKMMQSLLEYLALRGCECRVVIDKCDNPYELNGVKVQSNKSLLGEQYDWCDIVIIHLVALHEATGIARRFNKPVVHICHNEHVRIKEGYIVYNTRWLAEKMNLPLPSIVVHPPTKVIPPQPSHFNANFITLVNANDNKGSVMFKSIANQMPERKFLAVHGGYDKAQLMQQLPNINYRPYNPKGMDYSDTRIILVPSKAESWSLVAAEAMANGIPVICSDLPGLNENCGGACIFAATVADYFKAIKFLDDESYYNMYVKEGYQRVRLHNYSDELNNFYNFIENIAVKKMDAKPVEKKEIKPRKEKKEHKGLPTQK